MTPEESCAWKREWPGGSTDILPWLEGVLPLIPHGGTYVEIGTFFGRALGFVGLTRPDLSLVAVDPWVEGFVDAGEVLPIGPDLERCQKYGGLFLAFIATMQEFAPEVLGRIRVIRAPSSRGMLVLEDASVDACFVDGDHSAAAARADIEQAMRVVRPGGIIGVHDCGWQNDVFKAASELLPEGKFAPWPVEREGWEPGCSSIYWTVQP